MRFLDPIIVVYLLLAVWALFIGSVASERLAGTQSVIASDAREGGGAAVAITPVTDADTATIAVEVLPGSGAEVIATQLLTRGVLAETGRFNTLLGYTGVSSQLRSGRYEFAPGTPAPEVIRKMRLGLTREVVLVIPEGLRLEEVGELVVDLGVATAAEWEEALARPRFEPLLRGRPVGADLTGYLYPATYPLTDETTAESLVQEMVDAFTSAVSPAIRSQIEARGMTLHEVLTLASIIEREALLAEERPVIASVFLNRLESGIALYADPTVQFAITEGLDEEPEDGWWKVELTIEDLAVDSPYNTYIVPGLPPGPIANPGLGAILAVLRPAETDYFYFVAKGDGSHAFAETLAEHNQNVERYTVP